jgi:hypothetical protein
LSNTSDNCKLDIDAAVRLYHNAYVSEKSPADRKYRVCHMPMFSAELYNVICTYRQGHLKIQILHLPIASVVLALHCKLLHIYHRMQQLLSPPSQGLDAFLHAMYPLVLMVLLISLSLSPIFQDFSHSHVVMNCITNQQAQYVIATIHKTSHSLIHGQTPRNVGNCNFAMMTQV